jgi:uncharacterized flavoprotein (TIGR03862 family)
LLNVAIIGAGPAGLIAAEYLVFHGYTVTVYDQMPTAGRKFLLAGRSGLNLTHSEPIEKFVARYGGAADWLRPALLGFPPEALKAWCEGLGQAIFVGSSGRVFPAVFKAAPLLRAWLRRLESLGVQFAPRHRWLGWDSEGALRFFAPGGEVAVTANATLLAMGGASWPRMGSDGAWAQILQGRGVRVNALAASNCGVCVEWSPVFLGRFEGQPLKRIAVSCDGISVRGEAVVTRAGLEGGVIYALSGPVRAALGADGFAVLLVDLRPDVGEEALAARVDGARQGRSLGNFLRQRAGLSPVAIGLVQEALHAGADAERLSRLIKAVPVRVSGLQPIERAISSAGGIAREELNAAFMIERSPGAFAAGEMLDWDAPTGGYLLQACFSTGVWAAQGMADWLAGRDSGGMRLPPGNIGRNEP